MSSCVKDVISLRGRWEKGGKRMGGREGRREDRELRGGVCSDGNKVNIYVCTSNEYNAMLWHAATLPAAYVDSFVCTYVFLCRLFCTTYLPYTAATPTHPHPTHLSFLMEIPFRFSSFRMSSNT